MAWFAYLALADDLDFSEDKIVYTWLPGNT